MSARDGSTTSTRGRRALCTALLTPLLALALSVPAQAEVANRPFIESVISGLAPQPKPLRPRLEAPCGVAVNPADGTPYVADYLRRSIIGALDPLPDLYPGNGPCGLAHDGNNMYVNYWHGAVVNPDTGVIDAKQSFGIALDPETKSLYVNHRTSISVYKAPVEPGNAPVLTIGTGSLVNGYGVAVSAFPATKGQVFVADAGNGKVKVYDPKVSLTAPVREIGGANTAAGRFVSLVDSSLAIDQSNGNLLVADNTQPGFEHPIAAISEFNVNGLYRGQLEKTIVDGAPVGIAFDESPTPTNGQLYVTSGNGSSIVVPPELGPPPAEQGALYAFGPAGPGQKLTVTVSGAGQGSVTSSPAGIACPAACEAELNSGAIVTLTATPEPGSVFAGWSGDCTGTGSCQVILNGASAVGATFDVAPAALSIGAGLRSGTVSPDTHADPPAPGQSAALKLGRPAAQGANTLVLEATLPAAGALTAIATGLKPAHASLSGPGSTTLRLHLNRRGRHALAKSKTGRLSMRVSVSFTPSNGAPRSVIGKTVTFKTAK
jgi:hypothetical protein